ncbi:MAG: rod shape-determining protein MreC [Alphaproteobacteria bacterium]|nr:rod shape-determining protein MreC [Alphaproteobacteria bacterium]
MLFLTPSPRRAARSRALTATSLWLRFRFVFLLILSAALIMAGQLRPQIVTPVRVHIVDTLAPILDSLSRPADIVRATQQVWTDWLAQHDEIQQLRAENARLKGWQQTGSALLVENQNLKLLLNFHDEPVASSMTARVIAHTGAPFAANLIITAGSRDGVKRNMAAVTDEGLVGRVIEVGDWSSRILLLTDPESRVPVMSADGTLQAVIAGDGSPNLQTRYLPADAHLSAGQRFVTSGHGGLLPPNLPVAVSNTESNGKLSWLPAAEMSRLHYVRLVDYDLAGGEANPYARQLTPTTP